MNRQNFRALARRADEPTRRRFLTGATQGLFGLGMLSQLPAASVRRAAAAAPHPGFASAHRSASVEPRCT